MVAKGERPTQVARTLGIDVKTLRSWRKDAAEGRVPGARVAAPLPMDAAPGALSIVREEGESIAEMMARLIPVNTPEGVFRNAALQKIMTALDSSPIPAATKVSEFKMLITMAASLLDIGSKPGRPAGKGTFTPGGTNVTIRLENLSKGPRLMEAMVVDAEEIPGDEEEE
jgi:hypothetical protein